MAAPPPATGSRVPWSGLPAALRARIDERFASPVRTAITQTGGFSPGVAVRVELEDGRRAFIKAAHPDRNPVAPDVHRREARIVAALPIEAPVSRLLWVLDDGPGGWVVLAFEDIDGRMPVVPWRPRDLDAVLAAMTALARDLTPSPLGRDLVGDAAEAFEPDVDGWASIVDALPVGLDDWSRRHLDGLVRLEAAALEAVRGTTLVHGDIRADNVLLTADGVRIVDWPHARIGQPWLDLVWFAPSVGMQGGPEPAELLADFAPADAADPDALDAAIAAVAAFFTIHALRPPPPGLPTLRPFQAAQGEVARRWLADRTGWR